jgi:hypothetical protein
MVVDYLMSVPATDALAGVVAWLANLKCETNPGCERIGQLVEEMLAAARVVLADIHEWHASQS